MNHAFFKHLHNGSGHGSHKAVRIGGWVVLGLAFATIFALLFGFLVAWLWNGVMPKVFGLGTITYWQAVGLLILAKIFFAGGDHHGPPHRIKKWHDRKTAVQQVHDEAHHEYAPIPDIPKEQQELYNRYWEERGKAAFEAYMREQLEQDSSEE
jgi:hypothetical protein